jgi:hypothetical protein
MRLGFNKAQNAPPQYFATGENKMMMKKHAATLLILMLVGLTGLVNAQMSTMIKAQVPFDFVANGKTMPAGECVIALVGIGQKALSISSGPQHVFAVSVVASESRSARKGTALVFHRYGDRYFLAGIKRAGAIGYELPASRQEDELRAQNVGEEVLTLLASAN